MAQIRLAVKRVFGRLGDKSSADRRCARKTARVARCERAGCVAVPPERNHRWTAASDGLGENGSSAVRSSKVGAWVQVWVCRSGLGCRCRTPEANRNKVVAPTSVRVPTTISTRYFPRSDRPRARSASRFLNSSLTHPAANLRSQWIGWCRRVAPHLQRMNGGSVPIHG